MNTIHTDPNRHFWILPATEMRWLWKPMAEALQRRLDIPSLMIVNSAEDKSFYENQFNRPFPGSVILAPDLYKLIMQGGNRTQSTDEIRARATAFEERYGVPFMRDMVVGERNIGRGYLVGADGFPKSRLTKPVTHELLLEAGTCALDFVDDLITKYPPALLFCITGGLNMMGKSIFLGMQEANVPIRNLTHSRFGFKYYWAENEFARSSRLEKYLEEFPEISNAEIQSTQEALRPTGDFEYYLHIHRKQMAWHRIFYLALYKLAWRARVVFKGSRKSQIGYYTSSEIAFYARTRRHWRFLASKRWPMLEEIANERYMFFALQVEPELSLHGLAPAYIDQAATITQLSLNLPADITLLVKEHPIQVGRRSLRFYEKIAALPNVELLNIEQNSYPVMENAALVCAATSSVAHEAACMGRRVAYLTGDSPILTVPHVHHLDSPTNFKRLAELVAKEEPEDVTKRRRAGAKYYMAMAQYCLDMDSVDSFDRNHEPSNDQIDHIVDNLLSTLEPQQTGCVS